MYIDHFSVLGADVECCLHDDHDRLIHHKKRPAVLFIAGGAYRWKSPREKDAPMLEFLSEGFNVFYLDYSVAERACGYRPLREIAACVSYLRENAEHFRLDGKIAVLGFSAGGHLSASLGALWNDPELDLGEKSRPDALILCYPVLSTGEFAHAESVAWVTGGDEKLKAKLDIPRRVTGDFPPTFIWHAAADSSVPVENTLMLVTELQKNRVPYECHIFEGGAHGISTCTVEVETPAPNCEPWLPLCKTWLKNRFGFVK